MIVLLYMLRCKVECHGPAVASSDTTARVWWVANMGISSVWLCTFWSAYSDIGDYGGVSVDG